MLYRKKNCDLCGSKMAKGVSNRVITEFSQNLDEYHDSDFIICDTCARALALTMEDRQIKEERLFKFAKLIEDNKKLKNSLFKQLLINVELQNRIEEVESENEELKEYPVILHRVYFRN